MICVIQAIWNFYPIIYLSKWFHMQINQSRCYDKGQGVGRQGQFPRAARPRGQPDLQLGPWLPLPCRYQLPGPNE